MPNSDPASPPRNGSRVNGWRNREFERGRNRQRIPGAMIAGGAGFLGSHLCERLLEDGYRVYCLDNFLTGERRNIAHLQKHPRFVLMEHDVRQPTPAFDDVVEVYNLACPASPPHYQKSPIDTATTSVSGTLRLLELATRLKARFLLCSTSEVYGDPEEHPQTETYRGCVSTTGPRACYDESKRMAETLCYDVRRMHGTDVRVARIFNTYGARMRLDDGRVISNLVSQALRGQAMTIYGTGRQTRSFCHVSDMIEGLTRLMRVPGPVEGPVNMGNPEEYSMLEVAELISELTGRPLTLTHGELPRDDPQRRRPDITLARRELGWSPRISLRTGLENTIEWFAELTAEETRVRGPRLHTAPPVRPIRPESDGKRASQGAGAA